MMITIIYGSTTKILQNTTHNSRVHSLNINKKENIIIAGDKYKINVRLQWQNITYFFPQNS